MYNVLASELYPVMGDLRRSAEALQSVWTDSQFDYFISNYVDPAESILSAGLDRIEILLAQFNALTPTLEALE